MADSIHSRIADLESRITRDLEKAAQTYIAMSADLAVGATQVAAYRDPKIYRNTEHLLKSGRLVPKIVVRGGALEIHLLDAESGVDIGPVFETVARRAAQGG